MLRLALGLAWPNPRLFLLCKVLDLCFVIQVLRSDPAFGQLCVMAIQDSVNSPPIKKKKRANNNPAKYSLCIDLCMDQDLLEAFLSSFTLVSQPLIFHDFCMFKVFLIYFSVSPLERQWLLLLHMLRLILLFLFYSYRISSGEVLNCCLLPKLLPFEKQIQKLYRNTVI